MPQRRVRAWLAYFASTAPLTCNPPPPPPNPLPWLSPPQHHTKPLIQILMVGIWKAFQVSYSSETSWRLSFIVPATIVLLVAVGQLFLADDCPKGNYKELEAHGAMTRKSSAVSFRKVR